MLFLSLLLSRQANAQDCKAIPKALKTASPHEASGMYIELAQCMISRKNKSCNMNYAIS